MTTTLSATTITQSGKFTATRTDNLQNARAVAFSRDGRFGYVGADDIVGWYKVRTADGLAEYVGGVRRANMPGQFGLLGVRSLAVSPDDAYLYAASERDNAIAWFTRDGATGGLLYAGRATLQYDGLAYLSKVCGICVSPDGRHVYAVSPDSAAVCCFSRNASTGALTLAGVVSEGQGTGRGLSWANAVTASPDGRHVYVASTNDNAVACFSRDTLSGALTFLDSLVDGQGGNEGLMGAYDLNFSPDGRYLYVAGIYSSAVSWYHRDSLTGRLTISGVLYDDGSGYDGLGGAASVVCNEAGTLVFVAGYLDNAVLCLRRNTSTGALGPRVWLYNHTNYGTHRLQGATTVAVAHGTEAVSVACAGSGAVATYTPVDANGNYRHAGSLWYGSTLQTYLTGNKHLCTDRRGRMVYLAASEGDALCAFARDTVTGSVTLAQCLVQGMHGTDGLDGAYGLVLTPDERHLYVASKTSSTVSWFDRDTAGLLTYHARYSGPTTVLGATDLVVSPDGLNIYAAGYDGSTLTSFRREATLGGLTSIGQLTDGVGGVDGLRNVFRLAMSPDGNFVYAAANIDSAISWFRRDQGTGVLTYAGMRKNGIGGVTGLGGAVHLAITAGGSDLYVTGRDENSLVWFSRDASTGNLTYRNTLRDGVLGVNGLDGARGVAVTPGEGTVLVVGERDNSLSWYARAWQTGAIAYEGVLVNGALGVSGLRGPSHVLVTPDGRFAYVSSAGDTTLAWFVISPLDTLHLPPVTASPAPGVQLDSASVALRCSKPGVEIRYTLNGTDPTTSSPLYSTPIRVVRDTTIRAQAFQSGCYPSALFVGVYTINHAPVIISTPDTILVRTSEQALWVARATDSDGDPVSFVFAPLRNWMIVQGDSVLRVSPADTSTSAVVVVRCSDGRGGVDSLVLRVIVDRLVPVACRAAKPTRFALTIPGVGRLFDVASSELFTIEVISLSGRCIARLGPVGGAVVWCPEFDAKASGGCVVRATSKHWRQERRVVLVH